MQIEFTCLSKHAPRKSHESDAGWDIEASESMQIASRDIAKVSTGLHLNIPVGFYGQLVSRSSMARLGILVVGGVIDAGYTGEIFVTIHNASRIPLFITREDRIAQLLILPVPEVQFVQVVTLPDTPRGANGFGSTGA